MFKKKKPHNLIADGNKNSGKKALLISILINVAFLLVILLLCNVKFETNDDQAMAAIASGATGVYTNKLVYISTYIGSILNFLYKSFPAFPWYGILMFICMGLSFICIGYVFIKKHTYLGIAFLSVILLSVGFDCYILPQFTKVAAVLCISGFMLLLNSALARSKAEYIMAGVLLVLGAGYRYDSFLCVGLVVVWVFLIWLITVIKQKNVKRFFIQGILILIPILVCFGGRYLSKASYNNDPEWKAYREFNSYRSELLDYGFPDYESNLQTYRELQISQNDLALYNSWNFADPEKFTTTEAKTLAEAKEATVLKPDIIDDFIKVVPNTLLKYSWIWAYFALAVLGLIFVRTWRKILFLIYSLIAPIIPEFYLFMGGRALSNRLDVSIFAASMVSMAFVILQFRSKGKLTEKIGPKAVTIPIAALTVFLCFTTFKEVNEKNYVDPQAKMNAQELTHAIENDEENIYFSYVLGSRIRGLAYDIFDTQSFASKRNFLSLGGWTTYSPIDKPIFEKYNFTNPFSHCINSDSYIICNNDMTVLVNYIKNHYDRNAYVVPAKEIYDNVFYRVYSGEPNLSYNRKNKDASIVSDIDIKIRGGVLYVDASIYRVGQSSYKGEAFVEIISEDGNTYTKLLTQKVDYTKSDDISGRFGLYYTEAGMPFAGDVTVNILYENDGELYNICTENLYAN